MMILPYAIVVSIIAYFLNKKLNVSDKKQIKIKKILSFATFSLLLFFICNISVLLEYQLNTRAIIRFATENIVTVKNHYILGKGLFITLFLSIVTFVYNYYESKVRAKRLAKESEIVNYEIDNDPEEKSFFEKYHVLDILCYVVVSSITYFITSTLFLKFIAFVVKNYIRYNV
jgi:hypothetical protein